MATALRWGNLALRFALELCAFAALGRWGARAGRGAPMQIALGLGAAALAIAVWGCFVAPRAPVRVPTPAWLALQLLVFGLAVAGLAATGQGALAALFGALVAANSLMLRVWRREALAAVAP